MRSAATLGILMAIVVGLLALTQFAAIQSSLQALTAGALSTYLGSFQFFGVLLVVLMAVGGLASVVVLLAAQLMTSGAGVRRIRRCGEENYSPKERRFLESS